jgi:subfamily B ATP-binding cassette protein MsbA
MHFYLRAISYYRPDLGKIIASIILIAISTAAALLQAYPLAIAVDSVFGNVPFAEKDWLYRAFAYISPDSVLGMVVTLAVITLLLRFVQEALSMAQTLLNIRIGYAGLMRVRCDLFRKLQALSLAYHKSQPQGDAIYRLSYDTYGFQTILNTIVQTLFVSSFSLLFMAIIMFSKSWQLTIVALSVAPLLLWTTRIYARILKTKSIEAKEVESQLTTSIQRSVATIGLVQAFGREHDEYERFHATARNSVLAYLRLHWQEVLYWLFVGNIFGLGTAAIFGYGGYLVTRGQITVGDLTLFLTYFVAQLYGPLSKLSSFSAAIAGGVAGVERVFEVLDRDPVIKDAPDAIHLPRQPRTLSLDHVWFEYRKGAPVLRDVTCDINPGQMVAFVGSSGVGKTTLLNLLPRFYDPVKGALRLDGHDLRKVKVADVRKHIALVLQESVVLPTTVHENIAYGRPDATVEQVIEAAKTAGAHDFIMQLPNQYEEMVTESGQNLSGGQKQRISIARALLTEAPIIIMDEPTSALDPHHEMVIIDTLKRIRRQRTVILVSHRLSTVADCDQIFVMSEGQIAEQGTHEQLVARRGLYYSMARHQMKLDDAVEAGTADERE